MRKAIFAATAAFLVLGFVGLSAACRADDAAAPEFKVRDLDGNEISLADYKGKTLFLNFWATWCPPCRAEIPGFIEIYKQYKDKGLEILGLSVDDLPSEQVKEWTGQAGVNYPVAMADPAVVESFRPGEFIPTTIIIDAAGRVRHRHVGYLDKQELVRLFEKFSDAPK